MKPRFIADVNLEKGIVDYLIASGYDVKWIPDYDCSMTDEELLALALKEKRILITNDKDFGELVFRQKKLSVGIMLFRTKGQRVPKKLIILKKLLPKYADKLSRHFTVVTDRTIRFIPMEDI